MQFVLESSTQVRPCRFWFYDRFFVACGIGEHSKSRLRQDLFQFGPEARIRTLRQRALQFADDAVSRVAIPRPERAADAGAANDSIGPKHSSSFVNCQHRRLFWRASNCNTVEAATTFLPRLPFGAKSRTFAPWARKRLYTVPREHRHRFARSEIEKYSWGTVRRARRSCTAVTGMPKSAAISSTVSVFVPSIQGLSPLENPFSVPIGLMLRRKGFARGLIRRVDRT